MKYVLDAIDLHHGINLSYKFKKKLNINTTIRLLASS